LKIVAVHLLNDFSGSPKVLSQAILALQKSGVDAELLTGRSNDGFLSGIVNKHCYFYYRRSQNRWLTLFSYLLSQVSLFFKVLSYKNQDVIIYVNTLLPFGAALAGKLIGKKVLYHIHETSITPNLLKIFLRKIVTLTATKVIFVSKSLAETELFNDVSHEVIYNCVDEALVVEASRFTYKPLRIDKNHNSYFTVLMVCSLKKYKGIDQFVEIANKLVCHSDLKFVLVCNADIKEIDDYFSSFNLPDNLTVHSRQSELASFYSNASLVLNLSLVDRWVETFGLTLLESMAYGVPVIAPPVGGPSEVVLDGVNGYLLNSYNIDSIKEKIVFLSENPNLCEKLSISARERVMYFSENIFSLNISKSIANI
jgi:glycosyltransferase involved in cell wall biosynthesis